MYCVIQNREITVYDPNFPIDKSGKVQIEVEEQPPTTAEEDFDVYDYHHEELLLMRKCFEDMWKIISKDNFIFIHQRNYLIFGHSKIGKTTLAEIIREKIHKKNENIRIYFRCNKYDDESDYFRSKISNPYIVIVDGYAVGEDDYADAKMIIVLADSCDNKYKTFQSKRCTLLMYIPPFTIDEVKKVAILKNPILKIEKKGFIKFSEIGKKKDEEITVAPNNTYLKNYKYYGGIIGNCSIDFRSIYNQKVDIGLIDDMLKGIKLSSLTKENYELIFIYETDETDVTKSGHLRFITSTIRDIKCNDKLKIGDDKKCKEMIGILLEYPSGSLAGNLYERIIFYLMKNSTDFKKFVIDKMKELNNLGGLLDREVIVHDVKDEIDLKNRIEEFGNKESDKINFCILNYDSSFPDIDGIVGPFGIQITIAENHKYSPEMTNILQKLYKIYNNGNNERLECVFFIISQRKNVTLVRDDRVVGTYPTYFQELLETNPKLRVEDKDNIHKTTQKHFKKIVNITFRNLREYYDIMMNKKQQNHS